MYARAVVAGGSLVAVAGVFVCFFAYEFSSDEDGIGAAVGVTLFILGFLIAAVGRMFAND